MMMRSWKYLSGVMGGTSLLAMLAACGELEGPDAESGVETPESVEEMLVGGEEDAGEEVPVDRMSFLQGETVLTFVDDPERGFVALVEHPDRPDDIGLTILALYPHPPLIAPGFAEGRDPVEAFLGLLEPEAPLPEAVVRKLSSEQSRLLDDVDARANLRLQHLRALADLPSLDGATPAGDGLGQGDITAYGGTVCTESFRNWVDGVYGGDGTCGQIGNGAFSNTDRNSSYTYGAPGYNYPLGQLDHNDCEAGGHPDGHCAVVTGNLAFRRQRAYNYNGNGEVSYFGHRQHYGLANCAGNGAVSYTLRRGGSTDGPHSVPVNGMLHSYWGTNLPSTRTTIDLMSYGLWNDDQGTSGSSFVDNQIEWTNNAGTNDKIIVCGEIQRSIGMSASTFACGPNYSLCTGGGTCDSACYAIVGY